MNTKLYLKAVIFSVGLAFTFGVAGLHGKVQSNTDTDNLEITSDFSPIPQIAEKQDSKAIDVPDSGIQNVRSEDAANDSKKEDIDTAIAELSRQIERNDSDAGLYLLRGNLHMDKQDYEQAVNDYTKAIEINPDDAAAYNNGGQAYANMGKYNNRVKSQQAMKDAKKDAKQAIKDYKKAIKTDPENIYAYINRGNAYYAKHRYQTAISDFSRVIEIYPNHALVYQCRAAVYRKMGNEVEYKNDLNMAKKYGYKSRLAEPVILNRKGYWEGSPDSSYYLRNKPSDDPDYARGMEDMERQLIINSGSK